MTTNSRVLPKWITDLDSPKLIKSKISQNTSSMPRTKLQKKKGLFDRSNGISDSEEEEGEESVNEESESVSKENVNELNPQLPFEEKLKDSVGLEYADSNNSDKDVKGDNEAGNVNKREDVKSNSQDSKLDKSEASGNDLAENTPSTNEEVVGSTSSSNANETPIIFRTKCKYGDNCYRKSRQHRQDFSHPEDDDYNAVDNRPECPYGLDCYRKNVLHQQQYKHTKKMQKPRKAKRQKVMSVADNDYDSDDLFIDDTSSDDYKPSDSGSDTDFGVEENEDPENVDSEEESSKLNTRSSKLKRKQKKQK